MISKALAHLWRFVRRRKLLTVILIVLLAISITPIIVAVRTYAIVHPDAIPSQRIVSDPVLEVQTESSTCGVHALSTIYRAYGLDPEAERIRWRLGIDTKALMWMSDSTGALHADLFMVLVQDFFEVTAVDLSDPGSGWSQIVEHLQTGHPAMLLIRRRENRNLHWVACPNVGKTDHAMEIYDSLEKETYVEGIGFLEEDVVSVLLVKPTGGDSQSMSSISALWEGTREMKRAAQRIQSTR